MALGPGQSLDGLFHWKCCPWIGRVWYDLLLVVCSKFISVSYDIRALLKSEACQKFMVVDYSIVSNQHGIVQAFYLTVKVSLSGCLAVVFTDCTGSGWLEGWIMLSAVSCPTLFVIQLIIEIDNVHFTNMGVSLPPPYHTYLSLIHVSLVPCESAPSKWHLGWFTLVRDLYLIDK